MKLTAILLVSLAMAGCTTDSSKKTASMDEGSTLAASENTASAGWDGIVQSIDSAGSLSAGGAMGATAAGAAGGYRVTVRKADGTLETVTVDAMPGYRVGDSVRYSNGALNSSPKY
ncbi:hypothetical protein GTP41_05715 [Pseudoduganella sp. DS3]|uniref:Lipoprotein n=1 Tax=Pseudoduganella guangdongensis TaxID=2692179 RepID=A0A6N9HDG6_9BURK|nr:hypothetical protein [Pseudoduganella guangdongensis]MYN01591.1 hypothetical protein [Pseudoduganella guangdongensis]